jgi:hypothetical protein
METDACKAGKGDPMCVGDLDSCGVEIGRGMQIYDPDRGSERPDYESWRQEFESLRAHHPE